MRRFVVSVSPDSTVGEIAQQLAERGIGTVPVIDGKGNLVGIVSEDDLKDRAAHGVDRRPLWRRGLAALLWRQGGKRAGRQVPDAGTPCARDVMTREVVFVGEDTGVDEIAALFRQRDIGHLPVVRDGKVVGMIRRTNLLFSDTAVESPHSAGPKAGLDPSNAAHPARGAGQGSKPCSRRNGPVADP